MSIFSLFITSPHIAFSFSQIITQILFTSRCKHHINPFNPECIISFQLPEAGKATLTLYNIRGQKVKTIANQDYESGAHKVTLDASNLPSGVYTIRIKSDAHTQTRRITLMK